MVARLTLVLALLWSTHAAAQPGEGDPSENAPTTEEATEADTSEGSDESESEPPEPPPPEELEVPTPPPAQLPETAGETGSDGVTLEDWNRDDWMLLKPKVSLIELNGYLRMRADLMRRLNFKNEAIFDSEGRLPSNTSANGRSANYAGTDIRLRLEPQINVTDKIQIVTTIDVLDNLVLGSTPDTLPINGTPLAGQAPNNLLARSQLAPEAGRNSVSDSIRVRRVYGRVTALSEQLELRFGRMPNHWGLGVMANNGDCLNCDYGDNVDRLAISFKAVGHVFSAMLDWVSNGPVANPFGRSGGQPLDALPWDDVFQYSLQVQKLEHPDDIKRKVRAGKTVFNYGLWNILRFQYRDLNNSYYQDPTGGTGPDAITLNPNNGEFLNGGDIAGFEERRNARPIYTLNAFGQLFTGNLELGFEGAMILGNFRDEGVTPGQLQKTTIFQLGGAIELFYRFMGDLKGAELSLKTGAASGDSSPGFGALSLANTQRGSGGRFGSDVDRNLNNFQFSPDYQVDLLMFREIVGTVTDAWYVRPGIAYQFSEKIKGSLAGIYSQAFYARSTPSCLDATGTRCRAAGSGESGSKPMGLEIDAELMYGDSVDTIGGRFQAILMAGMLFPFDGFRNPEAVTNAGGDFAWTVQGRLNILF